MATRPLESTECLYSPVNIDPSPARLSAERRVSVVAGGSWMRAPFGAPIGFRPHLVGLF
jgi:hypothetical protein